MTTEWHSLHKKLPFPCITPLYFVLYAPLHLSRVLYKSTLFMQNKANFQKSQANVTSLVTRDYENIANWTLGENKPNSKPIKPNQTQFPKSQNGYL